MNMDNACVMIQKDTKHKTTNVLKNVLLDLFSPIYHQHQI